MTKKSKPAGRHAELTTFEKEVLEFFAHLRRKSPVVFGMVTDEFITESLAEFPAAHADHAAKIVEHQKAKNDALKESRAENERIETLKQKRAQKFIDDARAKVAAEDKELQDAIAQRNLKAQQNENQ